MGLLQVVTIKMKKTIIYLIIGLILISLVSAEINNTNKTIEINNTNKVIKHNETNL